MVVEQEYADLYPLNAENLSEYLEDIDCGCCGFSSCTVFAEALVSGNVRADDCLELDQKMACAVNALLTLELDPIPYNVMMEALTPGAHEVGYPQPSSPVLVTCNFTETVYLLEKILKACSVNALLLMSDTRGYSVDNAVTEKRFTPYEILKVISHSEVGSRVNHRHLVIPGLAGHLKNQVATTSGWRVSIGPVSGFELPLFLMREGLI